MAANLKQPRIRDKAYRERAKYVPCDVPGCVNHGRDGDVVLAHINIAGNFGRSLKAGDDCSFYLCSGHHADMDLYPEQRDRWIVQNIVIPTQQQKYLAWQMGVGQCK